MQHDFVVRSVARPEDMITFLESAILGQAGKVCAFLREMQHSCYCAHLNSTHQEVRRIANIQLNTTHLEVRKSVNISPCKFNVLHLPGNCPIHKNLHLHFVAQYLLLLHVSVTENGYLQELQTSQTYTTYIASKW